MVGVEKSTLVTVILSNIWVIVGQRWSLNWIERTTTCMQSYNNGEAIHERDTRPIRIAKILLHEYTLTAG
jgi:hypothetical protein